MPKLYVIAGHGAGDPGACAHGYQEAAQVRKIAKRIKDLGGADVAIHNMADNAFASGALNKLDIPKGTMVLELHMDSAGTGAKGAHVIIKSGMQPDAFDKALANKIGAMLPGRANKIVGRSNLANVNRAARRGINYRLMETGFISDLGDAKYVDSHMDEIARAILEAAGIKPSGSAPAPAEPAPAPEPTKPATPASNKLALDGQWGSNTTRRSQQLAGTTVDGVVSNQPSSNRKYVACAITGVWMWRQSGYSGGSALIKAIQRRLGLTADGFCGPATVAAMQTWLKKAGIYSGNVDKSFGPASCRAYQQMLNAGRFFK